VFWTDGHGNPTIVALDSDKGAVMLVDPSTGEYRHLWADAAVSFLKGVMVVADVAYFGMNPAISRKKRDMPDLVRAPVTPATRPSSRSRPRRPRLHSLVRSSPVSRALSRRVTRAGGAVDDIYRTRRWVPWTCTPVRCCGARECPRTAC